MESITRLLTEQFVLFTLVLARLSGLMMTAPLFGSRSIPMRIRALLALALALVMAPTQTAAAPPDVDNLARWVVLIGGELLVGLVLGMGLMVLFSGIQLAGAIIGQLSGMSLADIYNPSFDTSVPLFSEFLYLASLTAFLTVGGHRIVMAALLDTFVAIPVAHSGIGESIAETSAMVLSQSFALAIQTAAPTMAAQLLANIVLGLVSRTLPQLNIFALGFGLSALVTFGVLAMSVGTFGTALNSQVEPLLEQLRSLLVVSASVGAGEG